MIGVYLGGYIIVIMGDKAELTFLRRVLGVMVLLLLLILAILLLKLL